MKRYIKPLVQFIALLLAAPLILLDFLLSPFGGDSLFAAFSQFLSLFPGKTGSYVRIAFYRVAMQHCDPDCYIGFGTLFSQRATQIRRGVYIGPQCNIGECIIGEDTLLASGVHVMSGREQHRFAALDTPIRDQGGTLRQITIGRDCWIGNGSLVMANIGDQCVIGAGSVVTAPLDAQSIAAGNPARRIRSRSDAAEHDSSGTQA